MRTLSLCLTLACLLAAGCQDSGSPADGGPDGDGGPFVPCANVHPYTRGDTSAFALPPVSAAAEPARGACVRDPFFGAEVCKAADATDFPAAEAHGVLRPVYSRWRAENSSGEYYFLVKDGETPPGSGAGQTIILRAADDGVHRVVSELNSHESAELRWDHSGARPLFLFYREGCALREYDAASGATALVHDFALDVPGCEEALNDVEGDSSADSRIWAFMLRGPYDGATNPMLAIVTYDRQTDTVLGTLDLDLFHALGGQGAELPRPNMVDVSPLGDRVVALFPRTDRGDAFDGPHAFALDFTDPLKVCNDETHGGWAFTAEGDAAYVCQVNNSNWPAADSDTLAYTNLRTGETQTMLYHEDLGWDVGGFHFGRFTDPAIRGWVYLSTYSEPGSASWLRNQAVMLELRPYAEHPRVWRLADTHNDYPGPDGYPREAYSPISGDGRTVLWGADWPGGDGSVDTYRLRLPADWWADLASLPACPE
ncbi:MAG TPA: hypothetical protein PK668_11605 [Myxococcota bacterium]|nr:hypothetical protein [Myxococcota bacterium]HRY93187.1 hypothetical protein [Myxococcota bacterium]